MPLKLGCVKRAVCLMGISVYDFSIKIAQENSFTCRETIVQQFKDIKPEIIPT